MNVKGLKSRAVIVFSFRGVCLGVFAVRVLPIYQLMIETHIVYTSSHTDSGVSWLNLVSFLVSDFVNKQSQRCAAEKETMREGESDWKQ